MENVDATCDASDLVQLGDTDTMINDSLTSHKKESLINNELIIILS